MKTYYVVIRYDLEGYYDFNAASPLLKSEEEAFKAVRNLVKDDCEAYDLNRGLVMKWLEDELANCECIDLSGFGLRSVYKIIQVDFKNKKEAKEAHQPDWGVQYADWCDWFEKRLKIPKVGNFYPREFAMGMLLNVTTFDPRWVMESLGFSDYVLPIDWKGFFTTGHTEFEDLDGTMITFDFVMHTDKANWSADISVGVGDRKGEYEVYLDDFRAELSKAAKYRIMSKNMGVAFQIQLISLHPRFEDEPDQH